MVNKLSIDGFVEEVNITLSPEEVDALIGLGKQLEVVNAGEIEIKDEEPVMEEVLVVEKKKEKVISCTINP